MASMSIDTGMPGPEESALRMPRERWKMLAMSRRRWAEVDLAGDCRLLRTVVEEAPIMALELGHESADKFLTDYIGLDLDLVHRVVSWLDLEKPTSATPLDLAVEKANNALNLQGSFAGPGRLPADTDGNGDIITIPMNPTGKGTSASYLALRLKKAGREDLLGQVRDGEIRSIRKAAIEAGIVKDIPTVRLTSPDAVAERIKRHWNEDQIRSLVEILLS
jgi:hypothetical protein